MTLKEFREKYPQYDDVDDTTLASGLHQKYYSDIPKDKFFNALGVASPTQKYGDVAEEDANLFGIYPKELHRAVTDVAQTVAAGATLMPGLVAGGWSGLYGGSTVEEGEPGRLVGPGQWTEADKKTRWLKPGEGFQADRAAEFVEKARSAVSVPFPTEGPIGKVVTALFEMISGQQLFTKAGKAVEWAHRDLTGAKPPPDIPTEGFWEAQTEGPGDYEVMGDIAAPSLDEAKMVARSPIVSTAIATLGEVASFTLFGKAIHATRAKNPSPSAADFIEGIEAEYKALPPSRIMAKRPPEGPAPVHVPGPHGPRALPSPGANWRGVQGGIEPEVVPEGPQGLPSRPPLAITGETPAVHVGGMPAGPPEAAVPQAGAPGFVAYDSQRAVVGPRKPYELPVQKEPPALPEKATEAITAPSSEGVAVSGAVQTNGGPLDGAKLAEVDAFYKEKTSDLNKQIKDHIPDAPEEAIRYIGTNKPTKNRPGLPIFQDDYFTGSSFTLQKNPKGHINEGLWETPFEALSRKRAQFENYPVKPPHELTYEQFSKGPAITDPTSPIRKHALPALKIGDEYAVGYNATTHLGVYEELMNEGSWPVDVPLEKAEPAWIVKGKGIVADPGATMRHIHRTLVEDAYSEGKVIPKAVKEQYPDIFEHELLDRAEAINAQMVDLANDMETWEGTKNIYNEKGEFVRRAKATYPPWFKKAFRQESRGFVADTINRYQFAKSKGVKNPFPNQPRRNRVINELNELIGDAVDSGKHIVEEGYIKRLLKSEGGFVDIAGRKENLDKGWIEKFEKELDKNSTRELVPGETYWIASDGRAAPLGLWTRTNVRGVPGGEHHFEFTNRIIRGADKKNVSTGGFISNEDFGVKTGAIRAHVSNTIVMAEAFGPVSQGQFRTIRKYVRDSGGGLRWEVHEPKMEYHYGDGFGETSVVEFARASLGMLKGEGGFLNLSRSKGPFSTENIKRARRVAQRQGKSRLEKAALGWSEFWRPWSTLPDHQLHMIVRYKFMGDLGRSGKFIDKQFEILKKYPQDVRKDLFKVMDGQMPADALTPELQAVTKRLRRISDWVGKMAVKRGLISEETFEGMRGEYIHYMYLKHFFPEEGTMPIPSARMDRGTFKMRKDLTYEQRQAIELIEDAAVAFPTGIGRTLADVFKYDYFKKLAENQQITWQPSRVAVDEIPVMRGGKPTGKTRPEMRSIGEIVKEIKMYETMAAKKEGGLNPVAQERYNKLKRAEAQAVEMSGNAPEGFRQMPISDNYGPLSGAFVRKPVYNDIVPLVRGLMSDPESGWAKAVKGFETATTVFKVAKVPLNPPTVIRNMISNMLQMNMSGIPLWDVPGVVIRGVDSFLKRDKFYRQLERRGGYHTNFTVAELGEIHEVFRDILKKGRKGYWPIEAAARLAKYYGRIDDIAKLSLYRHAITRKGMSPDLAAVHAQKWGMDYSFTSRGVKGARRTVLPFVTYQYKIAPLIVESMLKRPWVIGKFAFAPYILMRWAAKKYNWTEDDVEQIKKELAERTRKKKSFVIIPHKDNRGDIEFMNLEYYYPWGNWQDLLGDLAEGDVLEAKHALGFGGWWANWVHFATERQKGKPPVDPFSGLDIYSRFDSPSMKVLKMSEWTANLFLPGAITRHGVAGQVKKAITGEKDQWGRVVTPGQAVARFFGANIGSLNRKQLKIMRRAKQKALWTDFYRQMHDPRTTPEERSEMKRRMREKLRSIRRGEE